VVQKLEGGEYMILNLGDVEILSPSELHVVISPITSTVGAWPCQDKIR
jgi:hypothetical protein